MFGISFILEFTALKEAAESSAKDVADNVLEATTKFQYMKDHNSQSYCRDLLYLSYMSDTTEISEDQKHILDSQGQVLQRLIKSIYIDKDMMDVVYYRKGDSIYKKITRKFTIINVYKLKEQFKIIFSYNTQKGNEAFNLIFFKVNGEKKEGIENKYKSFDNTYDSSTALICDISREHNTTIEYKVELEIANEDKSSIFNSRYLTRCFEHNIEIDKKTGINRCDVSVFSLLNSINGDSEGRICQAEELETVDGFIKKRISNTDWMFPSDGYVLMFS